MTTEISDELLNAYVDNELDPVERACLLDRLTSDASVGSRACALWQTKQMLRSAYPLPEALPHEKSALAGRRTSGFGGWPQALAASLLIVLGATGGWLAHPSAADDADLLSTRQLASIRAAGGRVVLHLFSDEPARMEAALQKAEQLAQSRDAAGQPLKVEFIANGPGLHLLRVGGSPFAKRVAHLKTHANLRVLACHEAMQRMQERGLEVHLLPSVEVTPSAEGELAERLTQGWRYIQA